MGNEENVATSKAEEKVTPEIDYDKLEQIIAKRTASTEKGVMKSFLEQQGLSEEEINEAIASYKTNRKSKDEDVKKKLSSLEEENSALKKTMQEKELNIASNEIAQELGVEKKNLSYVLKLAEIKDVFDEKGMVKKDVLKASIGKVLEDIPQLKKSSDSSSNGGFKVGADTTGGKKESDELSKLRKIMGL